MPHAGNRPQPIEGVGVVHFHGTLQIELDIANEIVQGVQQTQIEFDTLADAGIVKTFGDLERLPVPGVDQLLAEGRQVVLTVGVDHVGDDLGAFVDQVHAAAQEVAGFAQALGIGVGDGQVAAAQQLGDLPGVDLVVLRLAAVDGLHVQRVAKDKGDVLGLAQIGQPVPAKQAFASDDQAVAVRRDGLEESGRLGGQIFVQDDGAALVEDANIHCPGV